MVLLQSWLVHIELEHEHIFFRYGYNMLSNTVDSRYLEVEGTL